MSEREGAEATQRESDERFHAIFNQAIVGIVQVDLTGRFVLVNETYCAIVGRSKEELLDLRMQDLTHPDDLPLNLELFQRLVDRGEAFVIEKRYVRPDGLKVWVNNSVSRLTDSAGAPQYVVAIVFDITDRKRAIDALQESDARFRNMAENAPVMIWITDPSAACIYFNRQWCEFTGRTLEQALGIGWLESVHPDDREESVRVFLEANKQHLPFRQEYRLRRHDGQYRWAINSATPRVAEDGGFLGYIGSVIDITERKEAEQERERLLAQLQAERRRLETSKAELQEKIEDLEKFHDVVVGRELKMMEMEKEIKRLKEKG